MNTFGMKYNLKYIKKFLRVILWSEEAISDPFCGTYHFQLVVFSCFQLNEDVNLYINVYGSLRALRVDNKEFVVRLKVLRKKKMHISDSSKH